MLDKLFGSKARVKLLKLFLLHPQEKFYLREIARSLGLQLNSVHRELTNLEDLGLVLSNIEEGEELGGPNSPPAKIEKKAAIKKQERKYYQANTDFIFYNEIKALVVKAQILYEKDFTNKLKKIGNIKIMILTGLFINQLEASIDLFLVGNFDKMKLAKLVKELEGDLVKEINYSVMTENEFHYRREIADIFLYKILDNNKIVVIDQDNVL